MKKYLIIAVTIFSTAAFAQESGTTKAANIERMKAEQYQTAKPVEVVVTAKRPVVKKDASPRKSEVPPYQDPAKAAKVTATPG